MNDTHVILLAAYQNGILQEILWLVYGLILNSKFKRFYCHPVSVLAEATVYFYGVTHHG